MSHHPLPRLPPCGVLLLCLFDAIHSHKRLFPYRPYLEEPRNVIVHKGAEPLGISIVSGENGGIFVSKVTGGSIAHQAGLEYGDQLLEV